ncbi:DNA polymerase [Verrucomicrobiaceae bacterium N1E253]|uniref:DNA polymerase n=1 Tax=Oceaniferula marina TaxID=2748318 RepID=A0A851GLT2_9BACT|nr:DNA polymerase [Oceaniferula marina]NWK55094.1 DNA polymerase [Oceaniferula marina]
MSELPLTALFVDFDAYFASAEQHMRPELRGQAVGVVPVMAESSCCIAASYEAKAQGVKTGTRVSDARRMCPGIRIVQAQPARYVELHHRLVAAVETCIHVEAVLSIDEMWCWLPYNWREHETVLRVGREIKEAVCRDVSPWIRASVGVAPNRWLAKMASKMRKPDGLLVIEERDLPEILYDLSLRDLHGVGQAMELRLHAHGIHDVRTLCGLDRQRLHTAWGSVEGDRLWLQLRGQEVPDDPLIGQVQRSIGHSHVLPPDKRGPDGALAVLHKLTQKAAQRLRHHGRLAAKLGISLRYVRGGKWGREMGFEPCDDSLVFAKVLAHLWKMRPAHEAKLLKVSVVLDRLTHQGNYTPSLFGMGDGGGGTVGEDVECRSDLNASMDVLVRKFGRQAIYLGGAHAAIDAAPMRISFSHVPDLDVEQ